MDFARIDISDFHRPTGKKVESCLQISWFDKSNEKILTLEMGSGHIITSARSKYSSLCKLQAIPNAWIRSLQFPCFRTLTVNGIGRLLPLPYNTVTVIDLVAIDGRGNDRYMKGSNVIDILPHTGQTSVDLYWPYQMLIIR